MMPFVAMRLRGSSGGPPPSTAPVLISSGTHASSANPRNINMPATVTAGDLLIVLTVTSGTSGNSPVTTPSGWTSGGTDRNVGSTRLTFLWKIAAGTEGGTSVNFATLGPSDMTALVLQYDVTTINGALQVAFGSNGMGASPASPALSPAWGSDVTNGWISVMGWSSATTVSGYPYAGNNLTNSVNTGVSTRNVAICTTDDSTATLTPGSFTLSGSSSYVGCTVAIRPA